MKTVHPQSTHYSFTQNGIKLREWSQTIVNSIITNVKQPILVYRGMSGTATATAVSLALAEHSITHAMVYVRKEDEQSHGRKLEIHCPNEWDITENPNFIFVDDFIDSGKTFKHCQTAIKNHFKSFPLVTIDWLCLQYACVNESYYKNSNPCATLIKTKDHNADLLDE